MPLFEDTSPEAEAVLIEGYRQMSPRQKMEQVTALNRTAERFARARLRVQYGPDVPEREMQLRLAALRLERDTMIEVFGWDPEREGY